MMLIINVHFQVKPDDREAFTEATLDNVHRSRAEAGITHFDLLQNQEDPNRFMLVEIYQSPEAQLCHRETAHYQRWRATVMNMLVEPYHVEKYNNLS